MASPATPGAGGAVPAEAALSSTLSSARDRLSAVSAEVDGGGPPVATPAAPPPVPAAPSAPVAAPPQPTPVAAPASPAPPAGAPTLPQVTASPAPVAAPTPPVAAPVEVKVPTREEIATFQATHVTTSLQADREAQDWVAEWTTNNARVTALGADLRRGGAGEIAGLEREIIEIDGILKQIGDGDDYEKGRATDRRRAVESDLRIKRLERQELTGTQKDLDQKYRDRQNAYLNRANQRVQAHLENIEGPQRILAHAAEFESLWEPAYSRVGTAAGIDPASIPDFTEYAKMVGGLEVDRTGLAIPDNQMDGFLQKTAEKYLGMVDRHHRAQAKAYAVTAAERAAQPAPAGPAGAGAPVAASPQNSSSADILTGPDGVYSQTRRRLAVERA